MQTGTVSRLWFCGRSWGFKIYIRWNTVYFSEAARSFQSVGCVRNKLQFRTVQTESEIISLDAGLRWNGIPALDCGIWSSLFFTETRIRVIKNGEIRARTKFVQDLTNFQRERNLIEWACNHLHVDASLCKICTSSRSDLMTSCDQLQQQARSMEACL